RLYYAIQQVRSGNLSKAENIYRLTIRDIQKLAAEEEGECRNAELATTTLLLALVLQKMGDIGEARLVFHRFFKQAINMVENDPLTECACTAKVLGAYALFEMKFGSVHRSIEVARRASQFDDGLSKLFDWKQFREANLLNDIPAKKHQNTKLYSLVSDVELPTETGGFRVRSYGSTRDAGSGPSPSVIYYAPKSQLGAGSKLIDLPVRIHRSYVECEAFGSGERYADLLKTSMEYIHRHGGIIICFRPEEQRDITTNGVAPSVFHDGLNALQLGAYVEYDAIPSILNDVGVDSIRLVSNNPAKLHRLRELGVRVRGTVPLVTNR
ncbi:hypothetical protein ACHAWF_006564, partial [Thalassiosira exigua]